MSSVAKQAMSEFPVRAIRPATTDDGEKGFPAERVAAAFRGFLESLGLDLADPNLSGTADRVARAYREMLSGVRRPEPALRTFPNAKKYGGIVSVTDIGFHSLCAHHFLPFFGSVHVAYAPGQRLVGLSKIARVVDHYARMPQLQENLTEQVASLLEHRLAPTGLIVAVEARHLCMEMRGVSRAGVTTRTTAVRGTFQDQQLQEQFFARIRGADPSKWGI